MNVLEKKIAPTLEKPSAVVFYVQEENLLYFNSPQIHGIIAQIHNTAGLRPQVAEVCKTAKRQNLRRVLYNKCELEQEMFFPCVVALRLSGYHVEAVDYA